MMIIIIDIKKKARGGATAPTYPHCGCP